MIFKYKLLIFYLLFLTGCATAPLVIPPKPPQGLPGIYHQVEKGQTLWRISKIYAVELQELVRVNRISDVTNIETGQLIFIPRHQAIQTLSSKNLGEEFIWPLRGEVISAFGQTFHNTVNKGINIKPDTTDDVVAARTGKVVFSTDSLKGFGKTLIIDHGDGFSSIYARNAQILVKAGDYVQKGSLIAKSGLSKNKDTYLHFQIRKGHIPQNPYFYLSR